MEISLALFTFCTFLLCSLGQDTLVPLPEFVKHPKEYSYIVNQEPVTLQCEAYDAMDITFNCMGIKVDPERQETYQKFLPKLGRILVQSTLQITSQDIQDYPDYWCECYAWTSAGAMEDGDDNTPQYILSRRGFVMIPYLKKDFFTEPTSQVVEEDSEVELICEAPEGSPEPKVHWKKGGHRIHPDQEDNMYISSSGSLIISNFQMSDEGEYNCVAKNMAGKVESSIVTLTLQDYMMAGENLMQADEGGKGWVKKPDNEYWATENKPVPITCAVRGAEILEFRCNGNRIAENLVDKEETGERGATKEITSIYRVSKSDLDKAGSADFKCTCYAWFIENGQWDGKETDAGVVKLADLGKKFSAKMKDMSVAPGSTVTYKCKPPRGNPKPKVFWMLNGQQLSNTQRIRIAGKTLTISQVNARDAGEITCQVSNAAGQRKNSARLTVSADAEMVDSRTEDTTKYPTTYMTTSDPDVPHFSLDLDSMYYTANARSPATLTCEFSGAGIVTFRCNGNRLPQDDLRMKEDYDDANNRRKLRAEVDVDYNVVSQYANEGRNYTCMCVGWFSKPDGSWGTKESRHANIKLGFMDQRFKLEPSDVSTSEGKTVVFECVPPNAGPEAEIRWTKNGKDVDTSKNRFELVEDGSLTIFNVRRRDEGSYKCVAQNDAGSVESAAARLTVSGRGAVVVTDEPEPETTEMPYEESTTDAMVEEETTTEVDLASGKPIFIRKPEPVYYVTKNKDATITCRTLGAEYLTFECNGERIPESYNDTYSAKDPETGRNILQRSIDVTAEQVKMASGDFECMCSGWYADNIKQDWAQIDKFGKIEIAFLRKHFSKEPMSKTVNVDTAVEIKCKGPKANPPATISWLKDGETVEEMEGGNVMISSEGSLILKKVQWEDEGNYTCVAENDVGSRRSKSAEIKVEYGVAVAETTPEPEPETVAPVVAVATEGPPEFTEELEGSYYVVRGDAVTLSCTARQTGKITFMCNGQDIEDDRVMLQDVEMDDEMELKASLEIMSKDVDGLDTEFSCECLAWYKENENGPEKYVNSARGIIELSYLDEQFMKEPVNQETTVGKMVTFNCKIPDGFPKPQISWNKNGEEINFVTDGNLVTPSEGALVILQAQEVDAGTYTCIATNIAGTRASMDASLTVIGETNTSLPVPVPESTDEMTDGDNVTSEAMPEEYTTEVMPEEYTTEVMPENTTEPMADNSTDAMSEYTTESLPENTTEMPENATISVELDTSMPEPEAEGGIEGNYTEDVNVTSEVMPEEYTTQSMTENITYVDLGEDGQVHRGESTPEPEAEGKPEVNMEYCKKKLSECMEAGQQSKCSKDHIECSSQLLKDCRNVSKFNKNTLDLVENLLNQCINGGPEPVPVDEAGTLPYPECRKLQMCYGNFLRKVNQLNFDVHESCPDMKKFLTCAHDAMTMCDVDLNNGMSTTLTDISDWFNEFCNRMPRRKTILNTCPTYRRCGPPVDVDITPRKIISVKFWCNYIPKTTNCRQVATADSNCKVAAKQKVKMDLHHLETQASKICPKMVDMTTVSMPDTPAQPDETKGVEGAASVTVASVLVSTLIQVLAVLVINFR